MLDLEAVTVDRLDLAKLGDPGLEAITEIGERRVRVRAVTDGARGFQGTLVFASWRRSGRSPVLRHKASVILVRFRDGADAAAALARLRAIIMPYASVSSTAELSRLTRLYYFTNTGIGGSFGLSTVIMVPIGVVIISSPCTPACRAERRCRISAVMRAIGGRKWDIAVVVFGEALIITGPASSLVS